MKEPKRLKLSLEDKRYPKRLKTMVSPNHPLVQLLALIDQVWKPISSTKQGRGAAKIYDEKMLFKVYVVSICKKQFSRRGLWRYLQANPTIVAACDLPKVPHRRTLDRRIAEIAPHSEEQIRALGLVLSLENVTDSTTAASDGSVFEAKGSVWHKSDKEADQIPKGLRGLDQEADWIYSPYHEWVYGYKAHVSTTVATTTVRVVLDATVTGSSCESHVLTERIEHLSDIVQTLLLDAGYDDGKLIERCEQCGIEVLVPLANAIGLSTSQKRRDRAAYLQSDLGKARYQQRGTSIEPFFGTIKEHFGLHPLPVQGPIKVSAFILLALYAWNLIVLYNF